MNRSNDVKIPLRNSATLKIQNDDKYCFPWSILAHLHAIAESETGHATRVSNYRQQFDGLIIHDFDFTNGFKCSDGHNFIIKDVSEAAYTMGDHEGNLQIKYDDISMKTRLVSTSFGSTFGTLRLDEKSFVFFIRFFNHIGIKTY